MAYAIVLQGVPKDCQERTEICPECGNVLTVRRYSSLPFQGVNEIELEVIEVLCEICDTHIVFCDVIYTETKEPPRDNQGGFGNQSKDSIVH